MKKEFWVMKNNLQSSPDGLLLVKYLRIIIKEIKWRLKEEKDKYVLKFLYFAANGLEKILEMSYDSANYLKFLQEGIKCGNQYLGKVAGYKGKDLTVKDKIETEQGVIYFYKNHTEVFLVDGNRHMVLLVIGLSENDCKYFSAETDLVSLPELPEKTGSLSKIFIEHAKMVLEYYDDIKDISMALSDILEYLEDGKIKDFLLSFYAQL